MTRRPTAREREHLGEVAALGCIACEKLGIHGTPAEVHHIRHQVGAGRRASHYETIPLCPLHHRTGGHGVAIHAGKRTWEEAFGTELELLQEVRGRLGECCDSETQAARHAVAGLRTGFKFARDKGKRLARKSGVAPAMQHSPKRTIPSKPFRGWRKFNGELVWR